MKSQQNKVAESAKTRDTLNKSLAVLVDDESLSSKVLYDLYLNTPTHMATKLHHVVIKGSDGNTYILGYTMLKLVSPSELLSLNGIVRKTTTSENLEVKETTSIEKEEE